MTARFLALVAIVALAGCGSEPKAEGGKTAASAGKTAGAARSADAEKDVICPVCGLVFKAGEAVGKVDYKGKTYYFLLADHKKAFEADPEAYLSGKPSAVVPDAGAKPPPAD
jgi:YHS domain-containing protein